MGISKLTMGAEINDGLPAKTSFRQNQGQIKTCN